MGPQYQPLITTIVFSTFVSKTRAHRGVDGGLLPRQTSASSLVDPVTMQRCMFSTCWDCYEPPPEICPLVNGICPNDVNASDSGGKSCGMKQYPRDCYCNLKTGLHCAWSCSWTSWWETENWFAKVCLESPALKLDFSSLPSCARQCLDDAIFEYGCLTQSSNCFCARGDLFKCHEKSCSAGDWIAIENWLRDTCSLDAAKARMALEQGTFTIGAATSASETAATETRVLGPPSLPPRQPPTWDEIFMFVILPLTIIGSLGLWVYSCVANRRRGRR